MKNPLELIGGFFTGIAYSNGAHSATKNTVDETSKTIMSFANEALEKGHPVVVNVTNIFNYGSGTVFNLPAPGGANPAPVINQKFPPGSISQAWLYMEARSAPVYLSSAILIAMSGFVLYHESLNFDKKKNSFFSG